MTDKITIKRKLLERLTLVGRISEYEALKSRLPPEYRVIQSGPYYDSESWPEVDIGRFLLIVEREITEPNMLASSNEIIETIDAAINLRGFNLPDRQAH